LLHYLVIYRQSLYTFLVVAVFLKLIAAWKVLIYKHLMWYSVKKYMKNVIGTYRG